MWRIAGWIAACLAALTLLIGGVRWIGHWTGPDVVPLPSADGCWQGVCPFQLPPNALVSALNAVPGVVPGSVQFYPNVNATGAAQAIAFMFQPDRARARALVLIPGTDRASIERDWRSEAAMMRLGDLIVSLGTPHTVQLSNYQVWLTYGGQRISLTVYPSKSNGIDRVRLSPRDFVVQMVIWNPDYPAETGTVYYPLPQQWQGFTLYKF